MFKTKKECLISLKDDILCARKRNTYNLKDTSQIKKFEKRIQNCDNCDDLKSICKTYIDDDVYNLWFNWVITEIDNKKL